MCYSKSMKKRIICAVCAILMITLCACGTVKPASSSFEAMDTLMTLSVYGGKADTLDELKKQIEELDSLLDATDESSEIYRLNHDKTADLSEETAGLMSRSVELAESTGGSFDPTVYPAVLAWGFTTGEYRVPDTAELKTLADNIDYKSIGLHNNTAELPDGVMLDLGAVAKGYAADKCAGLLKESGAQGAVLNLGGTILLYGSKPDGKRFKVGVADPDDPAGYFGYLDSDGGVIATSGGYERYFDMDGRRYIHILDPSTAAPVDNGVLSVTICCDSGAEADALSTALFVMGLDKAAEYYRAHGGFEYIILTDGGELYISEGIFDDFTLSDGYDFTLNKVSR